MKINPLHAWNVSSSEAVRIQKDLMQRIRLEALTSVQYIAGADVSYDIGSDQFYAGVVVVNFPDLQGVMGCHRKFAVATCMGGSCHPWRRPVWLASNDFNPPCSSQ